MLYQEENPNALIQEVQAHLNHSPLHILGKQQNYQLNVVWDLAASKSHYAAPFFLC